jgi:hypothetical protein
MASASGLQRAGIDSEYALVQVRDGVAVLAAALFREWDLDCPACTCQREGVTSG